MPDNERKLCASSWEAGLIVEIYIINDSPDQPMIAQLKAMTHCEENDGYQWKPAEKWSEWRTILWNFQKSNDSNESQWPTCVVEPQYWLMTKIVLKMTEAWLCIDRWMTSSSINYWNDKPLMKWNWQ